MLDRRSFWCLPQSPLHLHSSPVFWKLDALSKVFFSWVRLGVLGWTRHNWLVRLRFDRSTWKVFPSQRGRVGARFPLKPIRIRTCRGRSLWCRPSSWRQSQGFGSHEPLSSTTLFWLFLQSGRGSNFWVLATFQTGQTYGKRVRRVLRS